ncbi:hypothetical protein THASP1DRAFT_22599 [Thamnocephalis sphaerospora]|uniref:DOMON domain-containing protein n=1 Tax=Thamnocephalis sphaerospora TaxID=78915 RepID=A0A4P9XTR5_9FUNG|nr:hypothetical protein THASP1DRAFT_22599 [Thamnocephalis sphaerospora]|eukprot:RKP09584.1 hypothetical protein THASP1DRAFT_22599 [Thamnocephalis sphaerospora]
MLRHSVLLKTAWWGLWCLCGLVCGVLAQALMVNNVRHFFSKTVTTNMFTLYWKVDANSESATFAVQPSSGSRPGWIGFGFSRDGAMANSHAIVAAQDAAGAVTIMEYDITAASSSGLRPVAAANRLTSNVTTSFAADQPVTLMFTQRLSAAVPGLTLSPEARSNLIYAVGARPPARGSIGVHSAREMVSLALQNAKGDDSAPVAVVVTDGSSSTSFMLAHGVLMGLSWLVLVPMGMVFGSPVLRRRMFPKNRTGNPPFTLAHRLTQFIAFAMITAAFIIGLTQLGGGSIHGLLGIITYSILCLQIGIGIARVAFVKPVKPKSAVERFFKPLKQKLVRSHAVLGQLIWLLAVVTIVLGFGLASAHIAIYVASGILAGIGAFAFIWSGYFAKSAGGLSGFWPRRRARSAQVNNEDNEISLASDEAKAPLA